MVSKYMYYPDNHPDTLYSPDYSPNLFRQLNVSGRWEVTWDKVSPPAGMTLVQTGNQVTGSYGYVVTLVGISMNISYGNIRGTLSGYILRGTWSEVVGRGSFEFVFSPDGNSFRGRWGFGNTLNAGYWNGRRTGYTPAPVPVPQPQPQPPAPAQNVSVWDSTFNRMTLRRVGNRVNGTYEYRSGRIEDGILDGNVLRGRWIEGQELPGGRFRFVFNSNRTRFTGTWGRSNDEAGVGNWDGTLVSGQL